MTDVIKYPLSVLDDLDISGAAILERAAAHRVIEADELPAVLEAVDVARNGPEEQRPDNARAIAEAQERIEEDERADVADRMLAREMRRRDEECEPEIADPDRGVWAGPDGARALLASLEHADHVDPDSVTMLQTSLGFACDEVDTLRARVEDLEQDARASEAARLRAEVERLTGDVDRQIASIASLHNLRNAAMGERDAAREAIATLTAALYRIAEALGANLPPVEDREADDARLRISLGVADLQRRATYLLNSRDYWQAKAKRLERRVAALTEERDGLTLRLGAKVAREARAPRRREDRPDTAKRSKMRGIARGKQDRGAAAKSTIPRRDALPSWCSDGPTGKAKQPRKRGGKVKR